MKVSAFYEEISNFVEKHYSVRPSIKYVDEKSVEIGIKPALFIPTINLTLHIDAMRKEVICLSYHCSSAVALMVAGAAEFLEKMIPNGIEILTEDKRINVFPERVAEFSKVSTYLSLSSIQFNEKSVELLLDMK